MAHYKRFRFSTSSRGALRRTYQEFRRRPDLPENKARETALRILLKGTLIITGLFFGLLLLSYFAAGNTQVGARIAVNGCCFVYVLIAYVLYRRQKHLIAAKLLVGYFVAIGGLAVWEWGINMPFAILIMCITITLAAILLGARATPYTAAGLSAVILATQLATTTGWHIPDQSWQTGEPSKFGEAIGYCLLFAGLALVTWLFGREIERSLVQARQAEAALLVEKKLLAVRLKERTEKLRAAQLQEMQQLYRFAELGQVSTALPHDLANHLTSLTLDIEDLKVRQRSEAIGRAKQSIAYLDELVGRVSKQLKDKGDIRTFNTAKHLEAVIANLRPRFVEADVAYEIEQKGAKQYLQFEGDAIRFDQVMTILINNALDAVAADTVSSKNRKIRIQLNARQKDVIIQVSDWGPGIAKQVRNNVFKPFYSTKEDGMGIGLFITRQIIETHFKGVIRLEPSERPTTFTVKLPRRSDLDG